MVFTTEAIIRPIARKATMPSDNRMKSEIGLAGSGKW